MMSEIATDTQAEVRRNALVNIRRDLGADAIVEALIDNLHCLQGKLPQHATRNDWYMALAYAVRDRMMDRYIATVTSLAETSTAPKAVASRQLRPLRVPKTLSELMM
jgi:starch phosphorylase